MDEFTDLANTSRPEISVSAFKRLSLYALAGDLVAKLTALPATLLKQDRTTSRDSHRQFGLGICRLFDLILPCAKLVKHQPLAALCVFGKFCRLNFSLDHFLPSKVGSAIHRAVACFWHQRYQHFISQILWFFIKQPCSASQARANCRTLYQRYTENIYWIQYRKWHSKYLPHKKLIGFLAQAAVYKVISLPCGDLPKCASSTALRPDFLVIGSSP